MNFLQKISEPGPGKKLFILIAVMMLITMLFVSSDYGISWDEKIQKDYGNNILKFYRSGGADTSYIDRAKFIHLYGGFVETVSAVATKLYDGDVYNTRHFIVAIFGFLAMLFSGLAAKELGGWTAGGLALLFVFFTPVFFGHSMYNSKDIPFATSYIISIYFLIRFIRQLPRPKLSTSIFLSLSIAMSINIRIGGLLLIVYLAFFWLVKIISLLGEEKELNEEKAMLIRKSILFPLGIAVGAYFLGLIFWPYGLTTPLSHPFEALSTMANYEAFDSYNLFEGRWIHRQEVPWYYIPKWIWITVPLFITAGIFLIPFLFSKTSRQQPVPVTLTVSILLFAFLFPVIYIIAKKSNVYDGWRHALFIYPPLVSVCAAAWVNIFRLFSRPLYKFTAGGLLSLTLIQPAAWMYSNHPFESFYFSPLIGGINGAFKNYEIDYYGTSIREAVEWIAENSDRSKTSRVRCFYGETESCEHFVKKYSHLKYVMVNEESLDWDYSIVIPAQAKFDSLLLKHWPPQGLVFEACADTVPIIAVVKNFRTPEMIAEQTANAVYTSNDVNFLIKASIDYYNAGNYLMCVAASERVILVDPYNKFAYNNICSAFNRLKVYRDAAAAAKIALALDSTFVAAQANYAEALAGEKEVVPPDELSVNCTNLGVIFSKLGQYEACINFCLYAIKLKSDNAFAYNNVCSAYNALEKYAEAVKYGEEAVKLDPSSELFRNNLEIARSGAKGK